MSAAYAAITLLAEVAATLAPDGEGKLGRSLRARRGLVERIRARAQSVRDLSRPLVWLHAPSVGEGLQARPVLDALRTSHPTWQFAYTFFSPSAERFADSLSADLTAYLPFDRKRNADAILDAWRPSVLVFSKLDVWPVLVERARARGIPVVLISATMAARSGRGGWWSRHVLQDAYAALSQVGAIDTANAERLVALGVSPDAITVTGDTRFDQVLARAAAIDRSSPLLSSLASSAPTVVAGSTWPADEAVLLPAWSAIRSDAGYRDQAADRTSLPAPRLIIAPHEPTPAHCASIEHWATSSSLTLRRLSAIEAHSGPSPVDANDADVVLVDRVGVLGELYALADAAFVGGAFHSAGLHSVIEPAAFGAPVLFGPRYDVSREAQLLMDAGGACSVATTAALRARLIAWLSDAPLRRKAGEAARAVVESERGATSRSVALIENSRHRAN